MKMFSTRKIVIEIINTAALGYKILKEPIKSAAMRWWLHNKLVNSGHSTNEYNKKDNGKGETTFCSTLVMLCCSEGQTIFETHEKWQQL